MNEELNAILQKQIIGKDDPRFEFFSDDFYRSEERRVGKECP